MSALLNMLKQKWLTPPVPSTESFTDRTVLVTGATSGIGYAAATKFALLGASKVIISARSLKMGNDTKTSLEALTNKKDVFDVAVLDMCSYASVASFAQRISAEYSSIDIVVLNAGVRKVEYKQSEHGWEEDLQVNVLSTLLLGLLLLPKLQASKSHSGMMPVLQFVNSGLHERAVILADVRGSDSILGKYNKVERFGAQSQYVSSKLLLMLATTHLSLLTQSPSSSYSDVIITSTCPGIVASNLGRDVKVPGIGILLFIMRYTVQRTAEQGANTYLTGARQDRGLHGRFWKNDEIRPLAASLTGTKNEELAKEVFAEMCKDLTKHVPNVNGMLESL